MTAAPSVFGRLADDAAAGAAKLTTFAAVAGAAGGADETFAAAGGADEAFAAFAVAFCARNDLRRPSTPSEILTNSSCLASTASAP